MALRQQQFGSDAEYRAWQQRQAESQAAFQRDQALADLALRQQGQYLTAQNAWARNDLAADRIQQQYASIDAANQRAAGSQQASLQRVGMQQQGANWRAQGGWANQQAMQDDRQQFTGEQAEINRRSQFDIERLRQSVRQSIAQAQQQDREARRALDQAKWEWQKLNPRPNNTQELAQERLRRDNYMRVQAQYYSQALSLRQHALNQLMRLQQADSNDAKLEPQITALRQEIQTIEREYQAMIAQNQPQAPLAGSVPPNAMAVGGGRNEMIPQTPYATAPPQMMLPDGRIVYLTGRTLPNGQPEYAPR